MNRATQLICLTVGLLAILGAAYSRVVHEDPSLKIIGGHEAAPHSAPFTVRLLNKNYNASGGNYYYTLCGGSIISEEYVLTARHCVATAVSSTIYYGKHNINAKEAGELQVESTQFKINPTVDVALIKTPSPVTFTNTYKKVALPSRAEATETYEGQVGSAYGWGLTSDAGIRPSVLMEVKLPVISLDECNRDLQPFFMHASSHELCTSGKGVKGTCQGDSGGPFVVNNVLVGVTSWGPVRCEAGGPSVYVRVNNVLDWIQTSTGIVINTVQRK